MSTSKERIAIFSMMVICAILIMLCIKDGHNGNDDFALYIDQAKALINGSLYKLYNVNKYAMENSPILDGPYLYSNGFPLLLVPVYYFLGVNYIAMKVLCAIFLLLTIPVAYYLFKHSFKDPFYAIFIAFFIAVNYEYVMYTDGVLSDLPFLFFNYLSFLFMVKKNTILNQILLGAIIFFSYFTRDIGIVLIPTLIAYQVWQLIMEPPDKKERFRYIIPYAVFAFLYSIAFVVFPHGGGNHYQAFWNFFHNHNYLQNIINNLYYFFHLFFLLNVKSGFAFLVIAIIGAIVTWKQNIHFIVYTTISFLILIIWPACQGARFLYPVFPLFLFFLLKGLLYLFKSLNLKVKYLNTTLAVLMAIWFVVNVPKVLAFRRSDTEVSTSPEMRSIYAFIIKNIPSDEIIGFERPRIVRFFTNRNGVSIDKAHFPNSIAKYFLVEKIDLQNDTLPYKVIFQTKNYILVSK